MYNYNIFELFQAEKPKGSNPMADSRQGIFRNECASRVWKEIAGNITITMLSESDFLRGIRLFYFGEKQNEKLFQKGNYICADYGAGNYNVLWISRSAEG